MFPCHPVDHVGLCLIVIHEKAIGSRAYRLQLLVLGEREPVFECLRVNGGETGGIASWMEKYGVAK